MCDPWMTSYSFLHHQLSEVYSFGVFFSFFHHQSSDVFSFGVILCEFLTRLEADPDVLMRTRDFGIDRNNLIQQIDTTEVSESGEHRQMGTERD